MKKFIVITLTLLFSTAMFAQNDVTKFLGIPIDGTKSEMIQKLKQKGFTYNYSLDCLEGEFNGEQVLISVITHNRKVSHIMILDKIARTESQIKRRFNELCRQFEMSEKYYYLGDSQEIKESEDISYNISTLNKVYKANFFQTDANTANLYKHLKSNDGTLTLVEVMKLEEDLKKGYYKQVWFLIDKDTNGKYRIAMYYANLKNEANGEDL